MRPQAKSNKVSGRRVAIMTRVLDADWFDGRKHRRLQMFDDWRADVWVHDSGHAVIFSNQRMAFTEILSSQDLELPTDRIVWERVPDQEDFTMIQSGGSVRYQFNYEVEKTEPSIFRFLTHEMSMKPTPSDLVWRRSGGPRWSEMPISRIHVEYASHYLSVQTFHSFPQELTILRTQSLFEITN
jgi:hypothetical protein